jgi:hypothetical protein
MSHDRFSDYAETEYKNRWVVLIPTTARCIILVRASQAGSGGPAGPRCAGPGLYSAASPSPATRTYASSIRNNSVIRIKKIMLSG